MKTSISKSQAKEKIESFFRQAEELDSKNIKKIKRLAMKYKIKLQNHRRRFCKYCYFDLKYNAGKTRLTRNCKTIICKNCKKTNRFKIS